MTRLLILIVLLLAACSEGDAPDAYGTFEATEITVSAEGSGRLLDFEPRSGMRVTAGQIVGQIDTVATSLQRRELLSRRLAAQTRAAQARAEIDVLHAQLETAGEELARSRRLLADEAATPRQVNLQEGEVRTLERRIQAARVSRAAIEQEASAVTDQLAQIDRRLLDNRIDNPLDGTVLTTYVSSGELVTRGAPLYSVASLDTLTLRAYVTGGQLAQVRLGQSVTVHYDAGPGELAARSGVVTSVAAEAEFTPTPIQTREERADFVYAVEIDVPNPDGALKIGMPADVTFADRAVR